MKGIFHNYTEADKQFVIDHFNVDMQGDEIAKNIGVSGSSLRGKIKRWRKEGVAIVERNCYAEGEVAIHKSNSGMRKMKKVNGKLVYVGYIRSKERKEIRSAKPAAGNTIARQIAREVPKNAKRSRGAIDYTANPGKMKVKDTSGAVMVRVNRQTEIAQRPGETNEETINRYYRVFGKTA